MGDVSHLSPLQRALYRGTRQRKQAEAAAPAAKLAGLPLNPAPVASIRTNPDAANTKLTVSHFMGGADGMAADKSPLGKKVSASKFKSEIVITDVPDHEAERERALANAQQVSTALPHPPRERCLLPPPCLPRVARRIVKS